MSEPVSLEVEVTERIRAARRNNWIAAIGALADGERPPAISYRGDSLEWLRNSVRSSGRGFMIVSLHHANYLSLLSMPRDLGVDFLVGGNGEVERFLLQVGAGFERVSFITHPSVAQLRACKAGHLGLFFMADARLDRGSEVLLPFQGKAQQFTAFWADLAIKLDLNVLVALSSSTTGADTVITRLVQRPTRDAYRLTCQVFEIFEEMMDGNMSEWEDEALWALNDDLSSTVGPTNAPSLLARLAACDLEAAKAVHQLWTDRDST